MDVFSVACSDNAFLGRSLRWESARISLKQNFSGPLLRKSFASLAFFDLEEDFFACGRHSIYGKGRFTQRKSTNQCSG